MDLWFRPARNSLLDQHIEFVRCYQLHQHDDLPNYYSLLLFVDIVHSLCALQQRVLPPIERIHLIEPDPVPQNAGPGSSLKHCVFG